MPGSLGGLVVSLGINSAEFSSGLTKAEFDAKKFAESMERGISTAASVAASSIVLIGSAAIGAVAAIDHLSKQAAQFQDLSEKTGATAASLASFAVAAAVAGTSMTDIAAASVKLTKNLTGVDDESKAAGAALTALGIPIAQFKTLSPDKQIEVIAKALSKFEEGAGKTAVAIALFSKAGADALPFLKELGEGVGRVNILTDEQIKRADAYSDAQARTRATLQLYAQALATEALPAVTAFTGALVDAVKGLLGVNVQASKLPTDDVRNFAETGARSLAFLVDAADGVVRVFQAVGTTIAGALAIGATILTSQLTSVPGEVKRIVVDIGNQIDAILNRPTFRTLLDKQLQAQRLAESNATPRAPRPALNFEGAASKAGGGDKLSEAERFLESLKRQLETTQELTTVEKVLNAIQEGRLKGLTPALESQILAVAREIDQYKELKKWLDEDKKAFDEQRKAAEAAQHERDKAADAAISSAQKVLDANDSLRDEIAIILGGDNARKALEKQRVQDAINIKEQFLAERQLAGAMDSELGAIRVEIDALKERGDLLKGKDVAEQLKKDAEQLQQFKNIFADSFTEAFSSFIDGSKSASDAFKAFAKSVEQQITKLAAQNIANAIFGGTTGGGFDFTKILGAIFGSIGGGGGIGGGAFVPPGGGFASGTSFAPGGPTLVGEQGPEIVNLPRGASVTSNAESAKMFGPRMNFVINVLPGANTATAQQAAAQTGIAVRRAMARNT